MPRDYTTAQQDAIHANGRDVCVAAGAGSGKTGVLVERFVRIVTESREGILTGSQRAGVDQILVITFTDKATREMKARIVEALSRLGLIEERRQIETAYISTIHGLCSRLLQENPFEAGVDPRFRVMDEARARRLLRQTYEQVIERAYAEEDTEIIELVSAAQQARLFQTDIGDPLVALARGVESVLSRLRGAGRTLHEVESHWQRGVAATSATSLGPVWAVLTPILQDIRACAETLHSLRQTMPMALRQSCDGILRAAEQIAPDGLSLDQVREALMALGTALGTRKQHAGANPLENEIMESVERLRAGLEGARKLFTAVAGREEEAAVQCHRFLGLTAAVWAAYTRAKSQDGALDNDDLQEQAAHLLESSPGVRRRYRERFRHIMVDEFQDTNTLQMRVIELLQATAKMEHPNTLFVVGDVQQSIYAFRNADPGLFREIERRYREEKVGLHVELSKNFRTRPEILDAITKIFRQVWRDQPTPFVPLTSAALYDAKEAPSVEVMLGQPIMRRESVPIEAAALAGRIRSLVENGEVTLTAHGHPRRGQTAGYRDVAVLMRSLSDIQSYEEAFARAGVPYFVMGGGRGYYARHEIRDILNILTVLETPLNDLAVAATLRSPFVGIHTDTLYRLVRIARAPRPEHETGVETRRAIQRPIYGAILPLAESGELVPEESMRLATFLGIIESLAAEEDRLPVGRLLERLIARTHYDARVLCRPGGRRRLANVRKLLQMAHEEPVLGVHEFILRLRDMEKLSDREGEAPTEEEEADVVRIVTIHGAKGLEFPVVALADLGRGLTVPERNLFTCDPHKLAFGTRLGGTPNIVYEAIGRARTAADEEESSRLLYVALTRTREHLILSGARGRQKVFNWAEQLFPMLGVLDPPDEPIRRQLVGGIDAIVAPHAAYAQMRNEMRSPLESAGPDLIDRAIEILSGSASER